MHKTKKLYILLSILVVVCAAVFIISHLETKKEEIKNSGDVIMEISSDDVTSLSWTNETGTFSFTKTDDVWTYDDDSAFPVDDEKIAELMSRFESFSAAFTINNVDDYSQYGLDSPVCTITFTAGDTEYTVELGDYSQMDEERYVSIGDGNVYLTETDPLDTFDAVLSDVIKNDEVPDIDSVSQIAFTGDENYTLTKSEDTKSICADDIYFTDGKPLDTDNVDSYVSSIKTLELTDYVTYNATEDELKTYGLDSPELTITLDYDTNDADGNVESSGTFELLVSRNPEEAAEYDKAVEKGTSDDDLPEVTYYAQVADSKLVYEISESDYNSLTAASYDTLKHQEMFTADFGTVTSVDVSLSGEDYTFTYTPAKSEDADGTWKYSDEEFDVYNFKTALLALTADKFTDETPTGQEEISLTIHLDNEDYPTVELTLYRYDGTNCVACVNGEPVALVARTDTVSLVEAVNEIVLK